VGMRLWSRELRDWMRALERSQAKNLTLDGAWLHQTKVMLRREHATKGAERIQGPGIERASLLLASCEGSIVRHLRESDTSQQDGESAQLAFSSRC
jgi:hypothetical protein